MKISSKTALFPGSFNPFTIGHKSIVERALTFVDRVIIAIGVNDTKNTTPSIEAESISKIFKDNPQVEVITYSNLTVDTAKEVGADIIVRGVRSVADFEYEKNIADINRQLSGIETVILFTEPQLAHISSSLVRELEKFGRDTSLFLPKKG